MQAFTGREEQHFRLYQYVVHAPGLDTDYLVLVNPLSLLLAHESNIRPMGNQDLWVITMMRLISSR